MTDLVVFGGARMDAYLELPTDAADKYCDINTQKCVIELAYGSKIALDGVNFLIGGNGANVSVGTTRLGLKSVLVTELGVGPLADQTKAVLAKEVDTTHVTQTEGVDQGFGAVIMYQGERTILSYYAPVEPHLPDLAGLQTKWAYLTSTSELFENYYEDIFNWLATTDCKLAFNPGGRQIKKGRQWLQKYLERTELIFVNRREAEEITGYSDTYGSEKELLHGLSKLGPKICIITDGGKGSYVYDGTVYYRAGVMPVDSFERTGAGDAFSSGCLAAIIQGKSFEDALLWGTLNSTSVIGFVGPENGLLRSADMPEWEKRAVSCEMKVEEF